jgi:hypothetical protein
MREIDSETNNALADPALLTGLCTSIAEGSTLVKFCAEHDPRLRYKLVLQWINDDKERAQRYKLALDQREQHAKDLIVAELIAYLEADVTTAFEKDGDGHLVLKDVTEMPKPLQRLIAGVEFEEVFEMQGERGDRERVHVGRIHKIKFWDKPRSIETFMKHLAMLVERKDVNLKTTIADLIAGGV